MRCLLIFFILRAIQTEKEKKTNFAPLLWDFSLQKLIETKRRLKYIDFVSLRLHFLDHICKLMTREKKGVKKEKNSEGVDGNIHTVVFHFDEVPMDEEEYTQWKSFAIFFCENREVFKKLNEKLGFLGSYKARFKFMSALNKEIYFKQKFYSQINVADTNIAVPEEFVVSEIPDNQAKNIFISGDNSYSALETNPYKSYQKHEREKQNEPQNFTELNSDQEESNEEYLELCRRLVISKNRCMANFYEFNLFFKLFGINLRDLAKDTSEVSQNPRGKYDPKLFITGKTNIHDNEQQAKKSNEKGNKSSAKIEKAEKQSKTTEPEEEKSLLDQFYELNAFLRRDRSRKVKEVIDKENVAAKKENETHVHSLATNIDNMKAEVAEIPNELNISPKSYTISIQEIATRIYKYIVSIYSNPDVVRKIVNEELEMAGFEENQSNNKFREFIYASAKYVFELEDGSLPTSNSYFLNTFRSWIRTMITEEIDSTVLDKQNPEEEKNERSHMKNSLRDLLRFDWNILIESSDIFSSRGPYFKFQAVLYRITVRKSIFFEFMADIFDFKGLSSEEYKKMYLSVGDALELNNDEQLQINLQKSALEIDAKPIGLVESDKSEQSQNKEDHINVDKGLKRVKRTKRKNMSYDQKVKLEQQDMENVISEIKQENIDNKIEVPDASKNINTNSNGIFINPSSQGSNIYLDDSLAAKPLLT